MVKAASSHQRSQADLPKRWARLFAEHLPGYGPVASAAPGEWFDVQAADTAVAFFPECLKFIEGDRAGTPFELELWQQAIIGCLFGWKRADGTRRYREAFIYVPRKNGKTPLCAGIVLLGLFCDNEAGAQIYSAAAEREQAALVFRHAAGMILREPELDRRARIYKTFKSIEYPDQGSIYKALSADADTKHGFNSHLVIVDELHAHPNADLVDVLQTSTGSRTQPLIVHITTADYDRESICNDKYNYAASVRDGIYEDSSFLPVIYEASTEDDWTDPKVWAKANPNLGVSVRMEYLERECKRAQNQPSYENTFKRLHLNIRTQQDVRWISLEKWDQCGGAVVEEELLGRPCFGALDLSTKIDITCWGLLFPPHGDDELWHYLPRFWVPGENAHEREVRDRVPYETWARQGFLTLTDGNVVDYEAVKAQVLDDARKFELREVAYDPWNATQIALQLQEEGAEVVEFGQGYRSMSEPTKELERLIAAKLLAHGGNPVMRWMAANAAAEQDPAGNLKPSKKKSNERIDGIVTLVMALGRALVAEDDTIQPGVYAL